MNAQFVTLLSNLSLLKHLNLIASVQKANTVKIKDLADPALQTALPAKMTSIHLAALNASSPALLTHMVIFITIKLVSAIHRIKLKLLLVAFHSKQTVDLIVTTTLNTIMGKTFALHVKAPGLKNVTNILVRLLIKVASQHSLKPALQWVIINATAR